MNTTVVTICAPPSVAARALTVQSAQRFNIPILVTQQQDFWEDFYQNKIVNLYRDLCNLDSDIILFVDSEDVFFTAKDSVERAVDVFLKCGKEILMSGEINCFPWPSRHKLLFPQDGPRHKFPNVGVYMGYRAAILKELEKAIQNKINDEYIEDGWHRGNNDTIPWYDTVLSGRAAVESSEKWCLTIYGLTDQEIQESLKSGWPLMMHGPSYENKGRIRKLYGRL